MRDTYIKGHRVIVSEEDAELLKHITHIQYKPNGDYDAVMCHGERLHRLVMNAAGIFNYIDHINGNVLDNRRLNLRTATNAQNQMNARPHRDKKTGLPKCVTKATSNPGFPYQVRVSAYGTRVHVGYFATVEAAEKAAIRWMNILQGEYAYHNSQEKSNTATIPAV